MVQARPNAKGEFMRARRLLLNLVAVAATVFLAGCYVTTANSFTGGTSNCAAVNKLVSGATLGFWQDVYKG